LFLITAVRAGDDGVQLHSLATRISLATAGEIPDGDESQAGQAKVDQYDVIDHVVRKENRSGAQQADTQRQHAPVPSEPDYSTDCRKSNETLNQIVHIPAPRLKRPKTQHGTHRSKKGVAAWGSRSREQRADRTQLV
jgi:hypothetical protein